MATKKNTTPRVTRTPAERATEALAIAERRVTRIDADLVRLQNEMDAAKNDLADAVRRRDYAAMHPDLPAAENGKSTTVTRLDA